MKNDVKMLVEMLEEMVVELEKIAPPTYQAGELTIEDGKVPGGHYLTISRTVDGYIAIDEGEYGEWHTMIKIKREHQEY